MTHFSPWRSFLPACLAMALVFSPRYANSAGFDSSASGPGSHDLVAIQQAVGQLSVPFIENLGQLDPRVKYYARMLGGSLFVTKAGEIVYALSATPNYVGKTMVDAAHQRNGQAQLVMTEQVVAGQAPSFGRGPKVATQIAIFHGDKPRDWQTGLSAYESIRFGEIYPKIELELKARGSQVEKFFHLQPGGDASLISMALHGVEAVVIDASGRLRVNTSQGEVYFTAPVAWQTIEGKRIPVAVAYRLLGSATVERSDAQTRQYGFRVSDYDPSYALTIDPLLQSTYVNGSSPDDASSIAINPDNGNVYVAGQTTSSDFPGTGSAADTSFVGTSEGFIVRLSSDLQTLSQATFLGGSDSDHIYGLSIHPVSKDVYVTGFTFSDDFPGISAGADTSRAGKEAYIARLSADLQTLRQATYLGGSSDDTAFALAIHPVNRDIYVAGNTFSNDFPAITNGADTSRLDTEGFVARLTENLQSLTQSTFLGGSKADSATGLAIDASSGQVYATGVTYSTNFPAVSGGADTGLTGTNDAFVARFSADLQSLPQATYLGGSDQEIYSGTYAAIAIHPGNSQVYVSGTTKSSDFPAISSGADTTFGGDSEAFVASFTSNLQSLNQATYLGGSGTEFGYNLVIHPANGNIYACGHTYSSDFPGVAGAADAVQVNAEGFIAELDASLQSLQQSTYLGGGNLDFVFDLAIGPGNGHVYAVGNTWSTDLPQLSGGADTTRSATSNAPYVSVLDSLSSVATPGLLQFTASDIVVDEQAGSATISVSRSAGSTGLVSVQYISVDDSAIAGSDYTAVMGTLVWINGDTADKSFTINILDDEQEEQQEKLGLQLFNAVGATLGGQSSATLAINDNDLGIYFVIPAENGNTIVFTL